MRGVHITAGGGRKRRVCTSSCLYAGLCRRLHGLSVFFCRRHIILCSPLPLSYYFVPFFFACVAWLGHCSTYVGGTSQDRVRLLGQVSLILLLNSGFVCLLSFFFVLFCFVSMLLLLDTSSETGDQSTNQPSERPTDRPTGRPNDQSINQHWLEKPPFTHCAPANEGVQSILGDGPHRLHVREGTGPSQKEATVFPVGKAGAQRRVPGVDLEQRKTQQQKTKHAHPTTKKAIRVRAVYFI